MEKDYEVVQVEHPDEAWGIIGKGITEYNNQQAGNQHAQILCFVLKGPDHEIAGGVIAQMYWDWLYVDLMWIKEEARHHGYGHRLLTLVEDEARKRGAAKAFLDTFSFQAPGFYEKHGYHIFGELHDFPKGHQRYFYTKQL